MITVQIGDMTLPVPSKLILTHSESGKRVSLGHLTATVPYNHDGKSIVATLTVTLQADPALLASCGIKVHPCPTKTGKK